MRQDDDALFWQQLDMEFERAMEEVDLYNAIKDLAYKADAYFERLEEMADDLQEVIKKFAEILAEGK